MISYRKYASSNPWKLLFDNFMIYYLMNFRLIEAGGGKIIDLLSETTMMEISHVFTEPKYFPTIQVKSPPCWKMSFISYTLVSSYIPTIYINYNLPNYPQTILLLYPITSLTTHLSVYWQWFYLPTIPPAYVSTQHPAYKHYYIS